MPQGSKLDPLFFLVYIDDIVEGFQNDIKHFAHDTAIFSVVREEDEAAAVLKS